MLWLTWRAMPERFAFQRERETTKCSELQCPEPTFCRWSTSASRWGQTATIVLNMTAHSTPGHHTLTLYIYPPAMSQQRLPVHDLTAQICNTLKRYLAYQSSSPLREKQEVKYKVFVCWERLKR